MKNLFNLLLVTMFFSCSRDNQEEKLVLNENDSLTFATYSEEQTSTLTFYRLTNNMLFAEGRQAKPENGNPPYNYVVELSIDAFSQTKDLINYFPDKLLSTERRIGNPGGLDGGILFLQLTKNNVTKIWELDSDSNAVPEEFRVFVQKVNEKINLLR